MTAAVALAHGCELLSLPSSRGLARAFMAGLDRAIALGADVIVVGRHGGGRIRESLIGSVPRFLAYYAPCDVLVV